MSPLDRLKRLFERKSYTLTDPDFPLSIFGITHSASGVPVTAANAMRVPAVAAAVRLISTTTGTLPAKVYERAEGGKIANPDHPAYQLVHDKVNPWTSATEVRTQVTRDALLDDRGGFALVTRVNGQPAEIHRLNPSAVTMKANEVTGEPFYLISQDSGQVPYPFTDIIHIKPPIEGLSPLTVARETIGRTKLMEDRAANLFSKAVKPSGHLSFPANVTSEEHAKIRKHFIAEMNSGLPIVDRGGEFTPHPFSSVDSQFLEMRRFEIDEIARAFGVSPVFLFELGRATWSNAEQMDRNFLTYTLRYWLDQWETQYRRTLLAENDEAQTVIEFVTDDILSVDFETRATAYGQYRSMGVMTANEVRAGLNLPAHANGNDLANPYTTSSTGEAA